MEETEGQVRADEGSEDLGKLKSELESAQEKYETAKKKIGDQGNEIGGLRKQVEEMNAKLSELATATPAKQEERENGQVDTLEDIRASLTSEQKKIAEEKFNALPDASDDPGVISKALVTSDPAMEKEFLSAVKNNVKPVRKSLFEEPQTESYGNDFKRQIAEMFKTESEKSGTVPPGSGNPTSVSKSQPAVPERKVLHMKGGSILAGLAEEKSEGMPGIVVGPKPE